MGQVVLLRGSIHSCDGGKGLSYQLRPGVLLGTTITDKPIGEYMKETPDQTRPDCESFDIDTITLSQGTYFKESGGYCAVEWANKAASCIPELREKYGAEGLTDDHTSISRVIRSFVIRWNDSLPDEDRTRLLKPFVLKILGTNTTPEDEETRAWMATDWLCRVHAPAWLRLAGLTKEAEALEATARIVDAVTAQAAQPALNQARSSSAIARDDAGAAARDAAWEAAWEAVWADAGAAAGAAAWDAAREAARDAAWDAARDAAWAAALDAAGAGAWDASSKLRPTVEELQASAMELLDKMCAVGRP